MLGNRMVPSEIEREVERISDMAGGLERRMRRIDARMDMDGAKKLAEKIKSWSKAKDLELYDEANDRALYPEELLEEEDPSPRNLDGEIMSPLDALERVLFELEINLRNTTVEQFFAGPGMILMPALLTRWIRQGMNMSSAASGMFAFERRVNAMTAHPLFLEAEEVAGSAAKAPPTDTSEKRLGAVVGALPTTLIGYRDKTINIGTYGRQILADYKFTKYATMLELRTIFIFIGINIAWDDHGNIYELIDVGDGSSGAPPSRLQISGAGGAGTLVWADLTTAIVRMNEGGFKITHWVGEADSLIDFLNLSQFTGANFRDSTLEALLSQRGPISTPVGVLVTAPNAPADNDHLAFWDGMFAVVKFVEQPITVEADKIIGGLQEQSAIHGSWAFAKFMHDASGIIDYSA